MKVPFVLSLTLTLLPTLSAAHDWHCAGGDTPCLIAALTRAADRPDRDHTLVLGAGTYRLTQPDNSILDEGDNGLPVIVGQVTIRGAGAATTIIERAPTAPLFRLFWIDAGAEVFLEGITIQGGAVDPDFPHRAGGIANLGTLTLTHVTVRNNSAQIAGGIGNRGTLHLRESVVEHNAAEVAGGIGNNGVMTVKRSVIDGNVADEEAGIGLAPGGDVHIDRTLVSNNTATDASAGGIGGVCLTCKIRRSTFVDNSAGTRGGGLQADGGTWKVRDVALVGNVAEVFGGGLSVGGGTVDGHGLTIAGNTALLGVGGGVFVSGGQLTLKDSVVTGNGAPLAPDCYGPLTLEGRSVVSNRAGCAITEK